MASTVKTGKKLSSKGISLVVLVETYIYIAVLGEKSPESLGNTFTHEHLSMTFEFSYRPPYEKENHMIGCPWTLENSGWIQQWPYVLCNLT